MQNGGEFYGYGNHAHSPYVQYGPQLGEGHSEGYSGGGGGSHGGDLAIAMALGLY